MRARTATAAEQSVPRAQVAHMQRSRLLAGAVCAVDELGYEAATVAHITARARVSRRTFYELFANREECLAAVLDDAASMLESELATACAGARQWRERVRLGLWALLSFLDREPALARTCIVEALRAAEPVQRRREELIARLVVVLDEGRADRRAEGVSRLTAEGLVGAGFAIVYSRLARRASGESLCELHGELLGMILLPYLGGAAARREQGRPAPGLAPGQARKAGRGARAGDPLEGVPMRLTYRTARVLEGVAQQPGASNRELAERAGIGDQGQVSKLLARLERLGLLVNTGAGHLKGVPNAWSLTPKGERIALGVRMDIVSESRRRAA